MPPKPQKKLPFAVGTYVVVKKEKCPGIIRQAVSSKEWLVETLNASTGKATNIRFTATSQKLRHVKDDEFPFLKEKDKEENELENEAAAIEQPAVDQVTVETVLDGVDGAEVRVEVDHTCTTENALDQQPEPVNYEYNFEEEKKEAFETYGPDDLEVEDFPFFPLDQGDADTFTPNDAAVSHGIETDDGKHVAKWQKYCLEKAALIDGETTFECNPPKQEGLIIGARVQERTGQKRCGTIFFDDRREFKLEGEPKWGVVFDGETVQSAERKMPSSKLKRIKDSRVFTWQVVDDTSPERPPTPYAINGVAGFDFASKFAPDQLEMPEGDPLYGYPFLSLLEHLWPGNWRSQLRNLNAHIEQQNSLVGQKHASKKTKKMVSGEMIVYAIALLRSYYY